MRNCPDLVTYYDLIVRIECCIDSSYASENRQLLRVLLIGLIELIGFSSWLLENL